MTHPKPESRRGVFARNIFSNFAGYGVTVIAALGLTPFIQEKLGGDVWAMWAVIVSMTGSYGLLDLGIRSAVGQYVTRHYSKGDMEGVNRTLNTAMALLLGVALVAAVVTIALCLTLDSWIEFEEFETFVDPTQVQWALLISGIGIAMSLPMALWSCVTYARERFDISNAIGIGETLVRVALILSVLSADGGIVGLAIVTAATQLINWLARMLVAYRLMPGLRWSPSLFDRTTVRELASFGAFNVIVNAADRVVISTDLIIVAAVLPAATTFYATGALLPPYFMQMILMVTWTMTPYATGRDSLGDRKALRNLLLNGTRGCLFLASVVGAGLLLTGDDFLHQWIDPTLLDTTAYADAAIILAILTWATLVRASASCGRQVLFGMRRMRVLAGLSCVEAILNLALSVILIHSIGTKGVAFGTLIPVIILYGIIQNIYLTRLLGLRISSFLGQALRASVPVMSGMYLMHLWVDSWWVIDSWGTLAVKIALLLVPAVAIGYLVVMNPEERRSLRRRLSRRGAE